LKSVLLQSMQPSRILPDKEQTTMTITRREVS